MTTLAERILAAIRYAPLDDDVLASRVGASSRQAVNQTARRLECAGRLRRTPGPEGKIVNEWIEPGEVAAALAYPQPAHVGAVLLSEDEVKGAVRDWLANQGFTVTVAMGHERGIDIDARHPDGRRWVVEAKAGVASDQQQGNYFLGALGELLQRMDDPVATYALALPNNRRYRGLIHRLPRLAKQRLNLHVLWVDASEGAPSVTDEQLANN